MAALVTEAMAREYLKGFGTSTADSLASVTLAAEQWLHEWLLLPVPDSGVRALGVETYTKYLDGPALDTSTELELGARPLVSVTSIEQGWLSQGVYSDTVPSTDYETSPDGRIYLTPDATTAWTRGRRQIKVVYTTGFTAAGAEHLVKAVARLAGYLWLGKSLPGVPNAATVEEVDADDLATILRPVSRNRIWEASIG